ncbi:MAG: hypothetical protein K0S54_1745 [Alphaproteobacteria bacterium]|jgi:hypothetical protein|nr:hypothetical protein [Alphaproteobacteria bacterium]
MAKEPLPHLDPAVMSHAPEPSLQPWMYAKRELVVAPTMHRTTALHAGVVLGIGALVLAMLASEPLLNWCNKLPAHPVNEHLILVAQAWHDTMRAIGLADVFAASKRFFAALRGI